MTLPPFPVGAWTVTLTVRDADGALLVSVAHDNGGPVAVTQLFTHDRDDDEPQRLNAVFQPAPPIGAPHLPANAATLRKIHGLHKPLRQILHEFDSFRDVIMCAPGCPRKTIGTLMTEWAFCSFMDEPASFVPFLPDGGMLYNRHGPLCAVCPQPPASSRPERKDR